MLAEVLTRVRCRTRCAGLVSSGGFHLSVLTQCLLSRPLNILAVFCSFRSINMQEFQDVVHFLKRADDWNKGEVEQTKRQLRDKLESYVQKVRGAVVLLSYTDAADNDKVRIAVKQVR